MNFCQCTFRAVFQTYSRATNTGFAMLRALSQRLPQLGRKRGSRPFPMFPALSVASWGRLGLATKIFDYSACYFPYRFRAFVPPAIYAQGFGKGNHVGSDVAAWFPFFSRHLQSSYEFILCLFVSVIADRDIGTGVFTWVQKVFAGLQKA